MNIGLHVWLKQKIQQFIFHVFLMHIFIDLSLLQLVLGNQFYFSCFFDLLVKQKISILFSFLVITKWIFLYSAKWLSLQTFNIEIWYFFVIKVKPLCRCSLDVRSIVTSLRDTIMNYNSFQFILIQLLIDLMIIINSIPCKWIDIKFFRERTISIQFEFLHCFIVEFESFEGYNKNLRKSFETNSLYCFYFRIATLA